MVWCSYCAKDQETENDDINGFTCCTGCGRVLDDNVYSSDPTFAKGADGQSQLQGNFIKDRQYSSYGRLAGPGDHGYGFATDSHEKTLEKGRNEISDIADFLAMSGKEDAIAAAHRLYTLAVERNFTRGRRTNQVAAACLYIVCRQDKKPFLLIDFSDCLQTNVYVLGAVFLQLCRLLSLEQHPIMQKPVDPSLFIHRFTDRLVGKTTGHGKKFHSIANTALRLVASMKRDWLQTGRRPSGICGAALFISAHVHGFECTKMDVVSVVHICEATLKRRLTEFEKTESGSLTAEEFEARAKDFELHSQTLELSLVNGEGQLGREVVCEHKDMGASHFALGLCRSCYEEYVRISGGLYGGAPPPAFQRAEQKKMEALRKQMRDQGLLSDDEAELAQVEGPLVEKKIKRRRGRPRKDKAGHQPEENTADKKEADDISRQPLHRGRRNGRRGCMRGQVKSGEGTSEVAKEMGDLANTEHAQSGIATAELRQEYIKEVQPIAEQSAILQLENEMVTSHITETEGSGLAAAPTSDSQSLRYSCHDVTGIISPLLGTKETERTLKCIQTGDLRVHGVKEDICTVSDLCTADTVHGAQKENYGQPCMDRFVGSHEFLTEDRDTFSDIDDSEVDGYLHNQEEIRLKTIIWTEMNKEYLEEQQAKQEALAASQAAHAAALAAAGADSASAVELAAAAAAAVAELKKDRKRKRAEAKNKGPAESAKEATRQMLQNKKLSAKVNYNALEKLFDGEDAIDPATKGGDCKTKDDDKNTVDEMKEEANRTDNFLTADAKGKEVKWADNFVAADPGNPPMNVITTDQALVDSAEGIIKDDIEEDEDFSEGDETLNLEDNQLSSYRLSYGEEYGDDGYDEY